MSKVQRLRSALSCALMCVVATTACERPNTSKSTLSTQQLLTEIEQICLDDGERSRQKVASQIVCNAECDAELTLQDSTACACQRERLQRDHSRDELESISALAEIDSSIRALREENVEPSSPLLVELNAKRSDTAMRIEEAKRSHIILAYEAAKKICDDVTTARSILRN